MRDMRLTLCAEDFRKFRVLSRTPDRREVRRKWRQAGCFRSERAIGFEPTTSSLGS